MEYLKPTTFHLSQLAGRKSYFDDAKNVRMQVTSYMSNRLLANARTMENRLTTQDADRLSYVAVSVTGCVAGQARRQCFFGQHADV